jgi:hypothetical protein
MTNPKLYPLKHDKSKMTSIEDSHVVQGLSMQHLPDVSESELELAKQRVFQRLETSKQTLYTMSQEHNQKKVEGRKNFFLLPIVSLAALAIIAGGGYYLYQSKSSNSVATTSSKIDYKKLTLAQKANARFKELTNGISANEVKQAESSSAFSTTKSAVGDSSNQVKRSSIAIPYSGDKSKLNDVIHFREYETTILEPQSTTGQNAVYFPFPVGQNTKVTEKTWISGLFSINAYKSSDNRVSFNLYSQDYSLDYRGGNYAVKTTYQRSLEDQLFFSPSLNTDPELSFLQTLINDTNGLFKKLPSETINGKTVLVFEDDLSIFQPLEAPKVGFVSSEGGDFTPIKTRYFVDEENLQFVKRQTFKNDTIQSESVLKSASDIKDNDAKNFINANNLNDFTGKSVEVKTIAYSGEVFKPQTVDLFNSYPVIVATNIQNYSKISGFISSTDSYVESAKLTNTTDFDPSYVAQPITDQYLSPKASYSNSPSDPTIRFTSYDIYSQDPTIAANGYTASSFETFITDKKITVNGEQISAKIYGYPANFGAEPGTANRAPSSEESAILFTYKGLWYKLTSYPTQNSKELPLSKQELVFRSLTKDEAEKSDAYYSAINNFTPRFIPVTLDKTPEPRLLPGDLSAKKFTAFTLSSNYKQNSDCNKLPEITVYELENCLVSSMNGATINFSNISPTAPSPLDFISGTINSILPAPDTSVSQPSELSQTTFNWNFGVKKPVFYTVYDSESKEIKPVVVELNSGVIKYSYTGKSYAFETQNPVTYNFYVVEKNGAFVIVSTVATDLVTSPTLTDEEVLSILSASDINKGYDELSKQTERSSDVIKPSMLRSGPNTGLGG